MTYQADKENRSEQDTDAHLRRLRRLKAQKQAQLVQDEQTIVDLLEQNLVVWRKRVEKSRRVSADGVESNRLLSRLAAMRDGSEEFTAALAHFGATYPTATTENLEAMAYTQIVATRMSRAQESN